MIHNIICLINTGCPRPRIALQCRIVVLKNRHLFIHLIPGCPRPNIALQCRIMVQKNRHLFIHLINPGCLRPGISLQCKIGAINTIHFISFVCCITVERGPNKRRVKPVPQHKMMINFAGLGDSSDDSDFEIGKKKGL